jgi:hypothetical protein
LAGLVGPVPPVAPVALLAAPVALPSPPPFCGIVPPPSVESTLPRTDESPPVNPLLAPDAPAGGEVAFVLGAAPGRVGGGLELLSTAVAERRPGPGRSRRAGSGRPR